MATDTTTEVPEEVVDGNSRCFRFRGWKVETQKKAALSTVGRTHLSEACELPHIPLPEIVFGDNYLRLTHEPSGWTVSFNAHDALMTWAQHQRQDAHSTLTSYDVMYSCEYEGSIAEINQNGHHPTSTIEPTHDDIPLEKLREHTAILFYDHVSLFEDDIRDLGEVELSVKIRVMPFGFLVLCRYFARLDEKEIKLQDARYYHEFGSSIVLGDFEARAMSAADLRRVYFANQKKHTTLEQQDQQPAWFIPTADILYANSTPIKQSAYKIGLQVAPPNIATS
ncbi:hypothetical protein, variant [Aphanomyces astaci]|uniref:TIP41-like protein n=1 Tax=Aphanomyces astaci TaxID=112090 RepID=W4GUV8_APHAT|nr:hypothetical protein, variant [Aphanomyces astaci]ETV83071.1 hypothetical protein, variant [Aphanomyces astaci]|eukprot:XP_009827742.1 hypothetical protein, variant [Aphanomyces astaci]